LQQRELLHQCSKQAANCQTRGWGGVCSRNGWLSSRQHSRRCWIDFSLRVTTDRHSACTYGMIDTSISVSRFRRGGRLARAQEVPSPVCLAVGMCRVGGSCRGAQPTPHKIQQAPQRLNAHSLFRSTPKSEAEGICSSFCYSCDPSAQFRFGRCRRHRACCSGHRTGTERSSLITTATKRSASHTWSFRP
jgi:hypothetical protein